MPDTTSNRSRRAEFQLEALEQRVLLSASPGAAAAPAAETPQVIFDSQHVMPGSDHGADQPNGSALEWQSATDSGSDLFAGLDTQALDTNLTSSDQTQGASAASQAANDPEATAAPQGAVPLAAMSVAEMGTTAALVAPRSIVFVDPLLPDYQGLMRTLFGESAAQAASREGMLDQDTLLVILDANRDGVQQITETLDCLAPDSVSALHLLTHGSAALVGLGNLELTRDNLAEYAGQFTKWGRALTEKADILLYGCSVGAGDPGGQFSEKLAELTGTDVAASTDDTGGASLGGDWDLEFALGEIEAKSYA